MMYDVVIVGAGPAGSTLAFLLAKEGLRVAICERKHQADLPAKPCGAALDAVFHKYLPRDMSVAHVIEDEVREITFRSPRGDLVKSLDGRLSMTSRGPLDSTLLNQALQAGADVRRGFRVETIEHTAGVYTVHAPSGEVQGRILVGADGAYSIVGRHLNLGRPRAWYVATDWEVETDTREAEQRRGRVLVEFLSYPTLGYRWVFPKQAHLTVGAGTTFRQAKHLRPITEDLLRQLGLLAAPTWRASGFLPFVRHGARFASDSALVVGDAAGLVDPATGAGIGWAVCSARLAAYSIMAHPTAGLARTYERRIHEQILPELQAARILRNLILLSLVTGHNPGTWSSLLFEAVTVHGGYVALNLHPLTRLLGSLVQLFVRHWEGEYDDDTRGPSERKNTRAGGRHTAGDRGLGHPVH